MASYRELTGAGVPTRTAAALVGVPRATATRKPRAATLDRGRVPVNKLTDAERAEVLRVVNSTRFVDLAPIQIYAQLLDEGVYLGSISTI
jgi:putative transposase